jgi:hypothetical protein
MSIADRLKRWRQSLASPVNEPDASAAPGLRPSGTPMSVLDSVLDMELARDGTPARLRAPESEDQDRDR